MAALTLKDKKFDLASVGNALVDVLTHVDDDFIKAESVSGMVKGGMTLIDEDRARDLYEKMPPSIEMSGGSAANTLAGFASLGGKSAFIAKVADDQLGQVFLHDLKSQSIEIGTPPLKDGPETGRCLILITPDAQRTMNTFLGASVELNEDDIDEDVISNASITYLEGYLFDRDQAKAAFHKAGDIVNKAGTKLALTLSDTFCVDRHREDFLELVNGSVDILFANEEEIKSLYQTDDFQSACDSIAGKCEIAAITRSEKGSIIINGGHRVEVDAVQPNELVDTTGAGDLYAAGFLYGLTQGKTLAESGQLGSIAAAEVISHIGPRPQVSLAELVHKAA